MPTKLNVKILDVNGMVKITFPIELVKFSKGFPMKQKT